MKTSKIAVVTGAAHRLGGHIALALANQGYAILLHYYSSESQASKMVDLIKSKGVNAYPFKADLTDGEQIKKLWEFIDSLPHRTEILINSAAVMHHENVRTLSISAFDETIALNLRAPLLCAQEAVKRMSLGGLIINISDIGADKNWLGYPAYSISKAALEVLTRILAKALAPDIRVNAIAPGLIIPPEKGDASNWENLVNKIPLKRGGTPDEITSMIEYLISNKYITGQIVEIDGGYSLI
ncbi:MAG: hypothetical protein A2X25_11080 [Chloroflexi bacterium GWB2_49_20]|nr:MAG: hypothetical protein A2X25_11080 [Chloroflexi bacterium GWB2_49_20]OGN79051.1 MAG: hypothetical protein A2X26_00275 [Chloroflexi bacterium GWC2_49_37]OGN86556.1 MAG: hypothetical protein A2X27_05505 [Chloroflexi bacterium GWD2_49_16]